MDICGVCRYLEILESTRPSAKVEDVIDGIRAEHVCKPEPKHEARQPHPLTQIGRQ